MIVQLIIEIVICVFFAAAMMVYLGGHFAISEKESIADDGIDSLDAENSDIEKIEAENSEKDVSVSCSKEKLKLINRDFFTLDSISKAIAAIRNRKLIWLFVLMIAFSLAAWLYDSFYLELPMMKCYINSVVFSLIIAMGYIDFKEHIIPNPLVLTGMGIWLIGTLIEVFLGKTPIKDVLSFSLLGFVVCGGLLLLLSVFMKSGLGMGDVKMFAMLGLLYGLSDTYSLLICTMIPMALVAIVLLARKKVDRKSSLPMAPFTVFAFLVGILGGM